MANVVRHLKTITHPRDNKTPVYILKVTTLDTINSDITLLTPGGTVTNIDGTTSIPTGASSQTWKINKLLLANSSNTKLTVKSGSQSLFVFPPSTAVFAEENDDSFEVLEGVAAGNALIIQSDVINADILVYVSTFTPATYGDNKYGNE